VVSPVSLALAPQRPSRGLRGYAANVHRAVTSIFEGLVVTMSWMFRRPATIQYPDRIEKPVQEMLPQNYRGILEVDIARCSGCLLCMRACPIGVIRIEVQKNEATGAREVTRFDIDVALCMFCGLCVEACNFDALDHSPEFEGTSPCVEALTLHYAKTPPTPVSRFKAGEGPPRRPKGSMVREVLPEYGRRSGARRWAGLPASPVPPAAAPVEAAETAAVPGEGRSDG
jgi:NADH-quinone oxidoreductase subunit I